MIKATLKDGEVTLKMSEEEANQLWDAIISGETTKEMSNTKFEEFDHALGSVLMGQPKEDKYGLDEYVPKGCSICGGHNCG